MPRKKKIELVKIDKKEQEIVFEETSSPFIIFIRKNSALLYTIVFLLSMVILISGVAATFENIGLSQKPYIENTSIDTNLPNYSLNVSLSSDATLSNDTAKNLFLRNSHFGKSGEVFITKTIETGKYVIKFYSDGSAMKIMKKGNVITRISPLPDGSYGIRNDGVIYRDAVISDVTIKDIKQYPWGSVTFYSDGSAEIMDSAIPLFVRNSLDITDDYISNSKVSYVKESKNVGGQLVNYYYDGSVEVINGNTSYIVRKQSDIKIENNKITFPNNNQAKLIKKVTLSEGKVVEYYSDGGAIIREGTKRISVRSSNSIIIKDNKILEIVDNNTLTISYSDNNGYYYSNGSAVVNYNGQMVFVEDSSNITYDNNGHIRSISGNYEKLKNTRNGNNAKVMNFETISIVEKDGNITIVPSDSVVFNSDGTLKEIINSDINSEDNPIIVTNNTNEDIVYRLILKKSDTTTLDTKYIRYQLLVGNNYIGPKKLNDNIWSKDDKLMDETVIEGTNYILVEKTLHAYETDQIQLFLWTDYETIPNEMMRKAFYGTIKIYAWKNVK